MVLSLHRESSSILHLRVFLVKNPADILKPSVIQCLTMFFGYKSTPVQPLLDNRKPVWYILKRIQFTKLSMLQFKGPTVMLVAFSKHQRLSGSQPFSNQVKFSCLIARLDERFNLLFLCVWDNKLFVSIGRIHLSCLSETFRRIPWSASFRQPTLSQNSWLIPGY
jgi:hypothetical protein